MRRRRPGSAIARGLFCLLPLFLGLAPRPAYAQLVQLATPELQIVFVKGSESFIAPYATRTFINSLAFQKLLFNYRPKQRTSVLLVDFEDYGDASATATPRNTVRVQVAPLSYLFETLTANERFTMIANHELVHVAMMDEAAGRDVVFRRLFGGKVTPVAEQPESILYFYLTTPRLSAPRWYHEGAATFLETWKDGGIGRAQGGYDEMVFRAMVRDHAPFCDPLALASACTKVDFQLEINSYLYGTRFMTWLAYQYSPDQVIKWIARTPGSRAYYASQFEQVFGMPIAKAWQQWLAFEQTFQTKNLAAIRKYPVTAAADLSPRALGSVSRAYYDAKAGKVYAAFDYQGSVAYLGAITKTGALEHFTDIKGPRIYQVTSLAWDPAGALFYTADNAARRDLMRYDLRTGTTTLLQKEARVGDLSFNRADRSLWGIRHLNGLCSIVRIAPPYKEWTRLVTLPFGTVIYDLDVSPDGSQVAMSWGEISGRQSVKVMTTRAVIAGDTTPVTAFDFGGSTIPTGFVFSPDGRYLYGSSYYTGASNIFRYEIATHDLQAVSNAETGFVRPVPLGGDQLLVFRYTGAGFVPARITATPLSDVNPIAFLGAELVDKQPVLKTWQVGSPATVPDAAVPTTETPYHLAGGLQLESVYPIAQGYKDTQAVGARVNFSDPLQFNRAVFAASYSPGGTIGAGERTHLFGEYQRYDWTAQAAWNDADFYDLFGPTKVSRKGYAVSVSHTNLLVFDAPRQLDLVTTGSFSGNLDQLPTSQNVAVNVHTLFSLDAMLRYKNQTGAIGFVDPEKGRTWSWDVHADRANGATFVRTYGTFDIGAPLPLEHSSVWWRSAAGFSSQDRDNPFANFYFGAFGNNYVDHGDEQRYRAYNSFPGADIGAINGRNFVKSLVEWNLPPVHFARVGSPGFYVSWMRPAIFVGGLETNVDFAAERRRAITTGGQLDFRFETLSVLDMTLSVGAGVTFEAGQPAAREAMISLKVLR